MPKRSNNCGRNSPSSGFPLPTKMNLAGWRILMPSRSTVFQPPAAESNKTSTKWSSNRFTSSTYKIPRFAFAKSPGSNAFFPCVKAFSMSIVPHTRSSVAPKGKSIIGTFLYFNGKSSPSALRSRTSWLITSSSSGEELYGSSETQAISGRRSTKARMVVVLPVPRSPMIITPPILGSMTFRINDSFISDCPTMAEKGYTGLSVVVFSFSATARH
mmetsp:Transcript_133534/g.188674  ORF Transcript_133534/g.188674 Transcript_133534/m.188674 type:complete len:215 (+) Transcript_133534:540-1184(+)